MSEIFGVTVDFYQTLVRHRGGQGRGASLMQYLVAQGLSSRAWEHQVLYDVFEFYGATYRPDFATDENARFWVEFTARLFRRLGVPNPDGVLADEHAAAVSRLLGPASLALFEDAIPTLEWLAKRGLPVGIISNWQRGLAHFCRELGILPYVRFVLVSAEIGFEKPDRRMFELAAGRLGLPAANILHVGDHPTEDARGAIEAGFQAALLVRDGEERAPGAATLASLTEIRGLLDGF